MEEITSAKPKDPKRVEAGKKLAAISKAAKEKKRMRYIESDKEWGISYGYIIGTVGLVVAVISLYYTKKADEVNTAVPSHPEVVKEKKCVKQTLDF